jgi:hypothetical protein
MKPKPSLYLSHDLSFGFYLSRHGVPPGDEEIYFRKEEEYLFKCGPTWFSFAFEALAAATNMGFTVYYQGKRYAA